MGRKIFIKCSAQFIGNLFRMGYYNLINNAIISYKTPKSF